MVVVRMFFVCELLLLLVGDVVCDEVDVLFFCYEILLVVGVWLFCV